MLDDIVITFLSSSLCPLPSLPALLQASSTSITDMNTASSSAVRGLEPNSSLAEVRFLGTLTPEQAALLSPPELRRVLAFLHYEFEPRRQGLLLERSRKALEIDGGVLPHFSPATKSIRDDPEWRCAPIPTDIQDRRVEITGPVDRKMVINGLNSGKKHLQRGRKFNLYSKICCLLSTLCVEKVPRSTWRILRTPLPRLGRI